ncbi:hypothetical protein BZG35_00275 [Brevundimonas sp. LM2]|uniref:alpha-glutamyl/putrescinyl thymine pyrophosphorylase clade 3 protein n=1 Tax=Brevundimonas sp. LM2 TaxID=1938605 RepID=UPI000983A780|nr:hypothetical protein [Brevundimonas sp. LM2]AQR60264.1 hypothetical protein BZG35_00275 [Brevundimonas sp. LM2]
MWPSREADRLRISNALAVHNLHRQPLPGISSKSAQEVLALQIVASLRREDFYKAIQSKPAADFRADPLDPRFDPERAVAFHKAAGNLDEAFWLIFLMTHFAKPADSGWLRLRDFYGKLGSGRWDWATVQNSPNSVNLWLKANWQNIGGKFGNHRKYQSLRPGAKLYTGEVVESYVSWIGSGGHAARFSQLTKQGGNDPFDGLYSAFVVKSFGRLARFDYLMLVSRYGLANISPTSAYLSGATGPRGGVSLLFTGVIKGPLSPKQLQEKLTMLDDDLGVGMSVLEDSLCNWQKSPNKFVHFKG